MLSVMLIADSDIFGEGCRSNRSHLGIDNQRTRKIGCGKVAGPLANRGIMQPDMLPGCGIRTLCEQHGSHQLLSYHLDAVWAYHTRVHL